jgi:hypothetical protein
MKTFQPGDRVKINPEGKTHPIWSCNWAEQDYKFLGLNYPTDVAIVEKFYIQENFGHDGASVGIVQLYGGVYYIDSNHFTKI